MIVYDGVEYETVDKKLDLLISLFSKLEQSFEGQLNRDKASNDEPKKIKPDHITKPRMEEVVENFDELKEEAKVQEGNIINEISMPTVFPHPNTIAEEGQNIDAQVQSNTDGSAKVSVDDVQLSGTSVANNQELNFMAMKCQAGIEIKYTKDDLKIYYVQRQLNTDLQWCVLNHKRTKRDDKLCLGSVRKKILYRV